MTYPERPHRSRKPTRDRERPTPIIIDGVVESSIVVAPEVTACPPASRATPGKVEYRDVFPTETLTAPATTRALDESQNWVNRHTAGLLMTTFGLVVAGIAGTIAYALRILATALAANASVLTAGVATAAGVAWAVTRQPRSSGSVGAAASTLFVPTSSPHRPAPQKTPAGRPARRAATRPARDERSVSSVKTSAPIPRVRKPQPAPSPCGHLNYFGIAWADLPAGTHADCPSCNGSPHDWYAPPRGY